jgi:hypothetical protein
MEYRRLGTNGRTRVFGSRQRWEVSMSKFLFGILASVAFIGGAMAADLPRKEPPPVAAPIGKAPIGKLPFGKGPVVARY